jgi:cell division initiation protein
MRITPLDVRKQEFRKAVRGFDCDEVRAFLSTLADEYETVLVDNKQIRELIMEQEDKIHEYQGMERNLRDTLMTAERVMKETGENASKKGDLIVQDAEMQAHRILEECRLRTEELRREIIGLRKEKETYLGRFKTLAQAQIQFVETHESDFEDLDNRLTNIVDSVVATAGLTRRKSDPAPAYIPKAAHQPTPKSTSMHTPMPTPAATLEEAPKPSQGLDPFAAENRIEGDPSTPRDLPLVDDQVADSVEEKREVVIPAAPVENDIWRDYNTGSGRQDDDDASGSIADLVSESLAEIPGEPESKGSEQPADQGSKDHGPSLADGPVMTNSEEPVAVGSDKDNN